MSDITIGVDLSKDTFNAHRLPDGAARQFDNDKVGFRAFLKWAGKAVERIVYEPTGAYHRSFESALAKRRYPLCKINPKQARRFAQALGTLAKTDAVDARILAMMGQMMTLEARPVADENLSELRELRTAHQALIKERTRLKNRRQTLTVRSLKRQHDKRLKQIGKDIDEVLGEIIQRITSDQAMAQRFDILASIPGIGPLTAAIMIIDMPELGSLDQKEAASLAGLAPMTRQSGKWRGTAFVQGGRKHLRDALYMPALVAAKRNPDLKACYERLIDAGKPAKLALTAIMRKLITIANALIRDNRTWAKNYP